MKRKMKMNLYLLLVILLCFCTAAGAEQSILWPDNTGIDPVTGEGWKIDEGSLAGWQDSNFETLEYQAASKSEKVGTGITVDGIKVDWDYPQAGNIGKGGDIDLDQSIDYTVVAFAEIPCVLKMDILGNGGRNSSDDFTVLNEENDTLEEDAHIMLFSPSMGGIVDEDWNFIDVDAVGYATGEAQDAYINACDLWTVNLWSNVPYGFSVSSTGMGESSGLEEPLNIEMRYLERVEAGTVSNRSGLPTEDNNDVKPANNDNWAGDYVLDDQGVEVGTYEAGQNALINMQFRVPITGAHAGRYQGEVTFSTYTI